MDTPSTILFDDDTRVVEFCKIKRKKECTTFKKIEQNNSK